MRNHECLFFVVLSASIPSACAKESSDAVHGGETTAGGSTGSGGPTVSDSCGGVPASARVDAWVADPHFCLFRFADVAQARGLAFAPNGDLFVATAGGQLIVLFDADRNGVSDMAERSTFAMVPSGNHGVFLTATHVYASSSSTVYRWTYALGQRTSMGTPETVVRDIATGGHTTRTLLVDGQNRLYVSVGSATNVDAPPDPNVPPAARAVIRRFDLASLPGGGYAFASGELFAAGLRNEVGLSLDSRGRIWGVENGRDDLRVGNDAVMYNDNPGEEVNLFDPARPGGNYGYPFCWSEGVWSGPTARGAGTQHLDPDVPGAFTEARCQDPSVVVPPAFAMRAHLAPLDIVEYTGGAYPADFSGNLFVTSHGSWNRDAAHGHVGRIILRLRLGPNGMPARADNFLGALGANSSLSEGSWGVRPVSIRLDASGLLTFSDDASGTIHKIGYRP